jgi:hypothetical protein
MEALALVTTIVGLLPTLAAAGVDIADLISKTQGVIGANQGPSSADWDALDAQIKDLQEQFRQAAG